MTSAGGQSYWIEIQGDEEYVELHVFARAYRDAWLAFKGCAPAGRHRFQSLGVTIEYEEPCKPH
jgi:hypothetical protein